MMKKKFSIQDIANELQISKTTVSFVLNGKAREYGISESLQQRVLAFVNEINYRPNSMAKGLRTGKSNTIGMMIEDISDAFFSSIARRVEENAHKTGYRIIYGSTENDTHKTRDLLRIFQYHQVDGYIIAPSPGIEEDVLDLIRDNVPVVIFDRPLNRIDTSLVLIDNYEGTRNAITHLINNGFRKIGLITLESGQEQMVQRLSAYKETVNTFNLPEIVCTIIYNEDKEQSIRKITDFLTAKPSLDAVFFATNYIAMSGLEAMKRLNLQIGVHLGVAAFDDYNSFQLFNPSITAVAQPTKEIADSVMKCLLGQINQPVEENTFERIILKTSLAIRESSRPISR